MTAPNRRFSRLTAAALLTAACLIVPAPAYADGEDDGGFLCTYFGDYWPYAFLCGDGDGGTPPGGGDDGEG
jgi:hypothetical protein